MKRLFRLFFGPMFSPFFVAVTFLLAGLHETYSADFTTGQEILCAIGAGLWGLTASTIEKFVIDWTKK